MGTTGGRTSFLRDSLCLRDLWEFGRDRETFVIMIGIGVGKKVEEASVSDGKIKRKELDI